jgi:hypothetical protein
VDATEIRWRPVAAPKPEMSVTPHKGHCDAATRPSAEREHTLIPLP